MWTGYGVSWVSLKAAFGRRAAKRMTIRDEFGRRRLIDPIIRPMQLRLYRIELPVRRAPRVRVWPRRKLAKGPGGRVPRKRLYDAARNA